MPILDIDIVLQEGEKLPENLASQIAKRAGQVLGSTPGRTWVKLQLLPQDLYAENNTPSGTYFPVFVNVLHAQPLERQTLQEEVTALTTVIAECCYRPAKNVHIIFQPPAAGRVAFGGTILPAD